MTDDTSANDGPDDTSAGDEPEDTSAGDEPDDVREWLASIRATVVGAVALLNDWVGRRGAFVRTALGGVIAATAGAVGPWIVTGIGERILRLRLSNALWLLTLATTLGVLVTLSRGFDKVAAAIADEMTEERHRTDGGTAPEKKPWRPKRSGAGVIVGLAFGVVIGGFYGLNWAIAGAIFGAVAGDALEEFSLR